MVLVLEWAEERLRIQFGIEFEVILLVSHLYFKDVSKK